MKRYLILAMICLVSMGIVAQYHHNPQTSPPPAQHQDPHHGSHPVTHNPSPVTHNQSGHHHHRPTPPPPPPAPVRTANPEQLQRALQVIQKQSYDDKRIEIAKLCVVLCPFTVRDLAKMVDCFTMEDRKVDFLIFAHPYCPDKENYYLFRDVLRFRSDYDKLMERVQPGYNHL